MSLLRRFNKEWRDKNVESEEQRAAEAGIPTEAQTKFAQRLKKEVVFKENGLEGQSFDSEQKG